MVKIRDRKDDNGERRTRRRARNFTREEVADAWTNQGEQPDRWLPLFQPIVGGISEAIEAAM